jgi:hypothetical protein
MHPKKEQKIWTKLTRYYRPINGSILNGFTTMLKVGSKIARICRFTHGEDATAVKAPA